MNAVILQPVTANRPDAMVRLWVGNGNRISGQNLHDICEDTPGVACSGYRIDDLMLNQGGEPVRLFAQVVSPHYFSMLGIEVMRGRAFTPETVRDTPDTVVVTHAFWERQLGSDPNVIGRKLVLSGHPYDVIGVLPRGFRSIWGLGISPSLYLPIGAAVQPSTDKRSDTKYEILGVVAPGQSLAEFRSRVLARAKALEQAYPLDNREFGRVQTFPVHRFGLFLGSDDPMIGYYCCSRRRSLCSCYCSPSWRASTSPDCWWRGLWRASARSRFVSASAVDGCGLRGCCWPRVSCWRSPESGWARR